MLTDDEARDAIRDFQAAIDRLVIDVAIALKPWAESTWFDASVLSKNPQISIV